MARPESARPLDTTVAIETPEHVEFRVRLAGPAPRSIAYMFDLILKATIVVGLGLLLWIGGYEMDEISGWSTGLFALVLFAVEWGYYVFFETIWNGSSPGKRMFRLRVIKGGGTPINFMDALLRNLLRAADFLPAFYALGAVVMGIDGRFRRLGDLVAGTVVVLEERARVADPVRIEPAPTPDELSALPSHVALSGDELEALEWFARRRPVLGDARANELAELLEPALTPRIVRPRQLDAARFLTLVYHRATMHGRRSPR